MWFPVGGPVLNRQSFPRGPIHSWKELTELLPDPAHADTKLGKLGPCFPPVDPPSVSPSP